MKQISISLLNDKYYKIYEHIFNRLYIDFHLINNEILFNYSKIDSKHILDGCIYKYYENKYFNLYDDIFFLEKESRFFNYENIIIDKLMVKDSTLIISNGKEQILKLNNYTNNKFDILLYYFKPYNKTTTDNYYVEFKKFKNVNKIYSNLDINLYKQFLKNLIINDINDETLPHIKYKFICCNISIFNGLGITASYNMTLQIPHIISTIGMSLKLIEKNGTLMLIWSLINIHIPIIKKIISILAYGFKKVEIIDNDININLLIGVPQFYIKCSGYKDNIKNELINKLLEVSMETTQYTYYICDTLIYYEDYTKKNPNHSLFYNRIENTNSIKKTSSKSSSKSSSKTSFNLDWLNNITKKSSKKTKKSKYQTYEQSLPESKQQKNKTKYHIDEFIYYIEDINIVEIDELLQDNINQFNTSLLLNKLETIFLTFFNMVNNLIDNHIIKNQKGDLVVSEYALIKKNITNIKKLIKMYEINKMPYNKHAINFVIEQQDDLIDYFYKLENPLSSILIKYNDDDSKKLNKFALNTIKLSDSYSYVILEDSFKKIDLSYKVNQDLFKTLNIKSTKEIPRIIKYATEDLTRGLAQYLNNTHTNLPLTLTNTFTKLWEILNTFNIFSKKDKSFNVFHICEAPGIMIKCAQYYAKNKFPNSYKNYDWRANTLNPYNINVKEKFPGALPDVYGIIKNNYNKWIWGEDNTGDITNTNNIKWYRNYIHHKWLNNKAQSDKSDKSDKSHKSQDKKLNLIIGDGGTGSGENVNPIILQKLDLGQAITTIACSSIGGSCIIKHFSPYVNTHPETLNATGFFISYIYLYYVCFDELTLFKPNTSDITSGEFYIIGKSFLGIDNNELNKLYKCLDNFKFNNAIFPESSIPKTFLKQINGFIDNLSNLNVKGIEKTNLLLTCYKNNKNIRRKSKLDILNCNNYLNKDKIDEILIPRYKKWIQINNFE